MLAVRTGRDGAIAHNALSEISQMHFIRGNVMPYGTVKFFNANKFGFLTPDDGSKEIFVPFSSVKAAGLTTLVAGQYFSFETEPDARGPKAVNLKLLGVNTAAAAPMPARPVQTPQLTFYCDPATKFADGALARLRANGIESRIIDYVAAPPSADELKRLSMLLSEGSLLRRSDALFRELHLDDRFIGPSEFWQSVHEHPTLINGPIVAAKGSAWVCRSEDALMRCLANLFPDKSWIATKPETLPGHEDADLPDDLDDEDDAADMIAASDEMEETSAVAKTRRSKTRTSTSKKASENTAAVKAAPKKTTKSVDRKTAAKQPRAKSSSS